MASYYTPDRWSETLICGLSCEDPAGILDPAVGDGSLLLSGARRFPRAALFGVDIDPAAVARTRRAFPCATVSRADALSAHSLVKTKVWRSRGLIDTVVINPPFAGPRRMVSVHAFGQRIACGVAAGHLLVCMSRYAPKRVAAILPRSLFHSERDSKAVEAICQSYDVLRGGRLSRTSFSNGSAASEMTYFQRRCPRKQIADSWDEVVQSKFPARLGTSVALVRGGVPVHVAQETKAQEGVAFVHTRELVAPCRNPQVLVTPNGRGVVQGVCILLPRVGYVRPTHLRVRNVAGPIQLSDCVLALCVSGVEDGEALCAALRKDFNHLRACWSGTGAPYTTVEKLRRYLADLGTECAVLPNWPPALERALQSPCAATNMAGAPRLVG